MVKKEMNKCPPRPRDSQTYLCEGGGRGQTRISGFAAELTGSKLSRDLMEYAARDSNSDTEPRVGVAV